MKTSLIPESTVEGTLKSLKTILDNSLTNPAMERPLTPNVQMGKTISNKAPAPQVKIQNQRLVTLAGEEVVFDPALEGMTVYVVPVATIHRLLERSEQLKLLGGSPIGGNGYCGPND
jgi:hypothetical protein